MRGEWGTANTRTKRHMNSATNKRVTIFKRPHIIQKFQKQLHCKISKIKFIISLIY